MRYLLTCLVLAGGLHSGPAHGMQGPATAALDVYVQVVSEHFGVPVGEVRILTEGQVAPEEVPVALRIAGLSGISPAAVLAQRRTGETWLRIARRYQLEAMSFDVAIPDDQVDARVERAVRLFRDTPVSQRHLIDLRDEEVVALVNVDLLVRALGVSHRQALAARDGSASFVEALDLLLAAR